MGRNQRNEAYFSVSKIAYFLPRHSTDDRFTVYRYDRMSHDDRINGNKMIGNHET